jgi:hypothetical protein
MHVNREEGAAIGDNNDGEKMNGSILLEPISKSFE